MLPIRLVVPLEHGSVTLKAWGAHVADAHLLDLMKVGTVLATLRDTWTEFRPCDLEEHVWPSFWALVKASLDDCTLPPDLTWNDRLLLLEAMWELNGVEESEGKLKALNLKVSAALMRLSQKIQGQMTALSMNT